MNKNSLIISLLVIFLAGCSTYKTNSDITFSSTLLSGEHPVIPVGKDVPSNMVTYLGWVEAEVTSPHYFSKSPTQEQVDIVLAKKAQAIGADAVIHVEYSNKVNVATLGKLNGKGQAVRINAWHVGEPDPTIVMSDNLIPNKNRAKELEMLINPNAKPIVAEPQNNFLIPAPTQAAKVEPQAAITAVSASVASTVQKTSSKAEIASLEKMLMQAKALKAYAKENKDKAMYKTATALVRHIEDHMVEFSYNFE